MRKRFWAVILAVGFLPVLWIAGCSGDETETPRETTGSLQGRVVLSNMEGLNDISRVSIDIGQGESVAPEADGAFRFTDLEAKTYEISIAYSGGLVANAEGSAYNTYAASVVLEAGDAIHLGDIVLKTGVGSVTGSLILPQGVAPSSVSVKLLGAVSQETQPNAENEYVISNVPVGTYSLSAIGPDLLDAACSGREVVVAWNGHHVDGPTFTLNGETVKLDAVEATLHEGLWYVDEANIRFHAKAAFANRARIWIGENTPDYGDFDGEGDLDLSGLSEGTNTVRIQFADACGFESEIMAETVVSDSQPPVLADVVLGNGSGYLNTAEGLVALSLSCVDEAGPATYAWLRIGSAAWQRLAYKPDLAFTLADGENEYTISVKCSDVAGHESEPRQQTLVWDHTSPEVSCTLNGGAAGEMASSPMVDVHVDATDALSGVAGVAVSETDFDCAHGEYRTLPEDGRFGTVISGIQGLRSLWICARDNAGNVTPAALQSKNEISLDTVPPVAGTLTLAGGADLVNTATVSVNVQSAETGLKAVLRGDLADGERTVALTNFPLDLELKNPNALNTVSAFLQDAAGNVSPGFFDVVEADTTPPGLGRLRVNGESWSEGETPVPVSSAVVQVEIRESDADTAYFKVSQNRSDMGNCSPIDADCIPATSGVSLSLEGEPGEKILYFRFFDRAQNGSELPDTHVPAIGEFHLELLDVPQSTRPVPALSHVSPGSVVAMNSENGLTDLTIFGWNFVSGAPGHPEYGTRARIGDFELMMDCGLSGTVNGMACTAAESDAVSCPAAEDGVPPDCINCCRLVLADTHPLMRATGSYPVRVVTPEPVESTGVSEETDFLHVVAPAPEITAVTALDFESRQAIAWLPEACRREFWSCETFPENCTAAIETCPSGAEQLLDELRLACGAGDLSACVRPFLPQSYAVERLDEQNLPISQDLFVWVEGFRFMDNARIQIDSAEGEVLRLLPDPEAEGSESGGLTSWILLARFPDFALPAADAPYDLAVVNAAPGGGQSARPFAVNHRVESVQDANGDDVMENRLDATNRIARDPARIRKRFESPWDSGEFPDSAEIRASAGVYVSDPETHVRLSQWTSDERTATRPAGSYPGGPHALGLPLGTPLSGFELESSPGPAKAFTDLSSLGRQSGHFHPNAFGQAHAETLQHLETGDIQGDFLPELAAWAADLSTVTLYEPRSDNTLADEMQPFSVLDPAVSFSDPVRTLAVSDLDGDGYRDLVTGAGAVFYGASSPENGRLVEDLGWQTDILAIADFNGDKRPDILVHDAVNRRPAWYVNRADGSFVPGAFEEVHGGNPPEFDALDYLAADFNGDGKPDIAISSPDAVLGWYLGVEAENGVLRMSYAALTLTEPVRLLFVGDLNFDGAPDLLARSAANPDRLVTFLSDGGGRFRSVEAKTLELPAEALTVADFDGDGRLDLLAMSTPGAPARFLWYPGKGNGVFALSNIIENSGIGEDKHISDFLLTDANRDGLLELAALQAEDSGVRTVFLDGRMEGRSAPFQNAVFGNDAIQDAVLGDFDNDGRADMAWLVDGERIEIREVPPSSVPPDTRLIGQIDLTDVQTGRLVVGDFYVDGLLDLALVHTRTGGPEAYLTVFPGAGDGSFDAGIDTGIMLAIDTLAVLRGDFDDDGLGDLALGDAILISQGDGTFASPMDFSERSILELHSADLTADGRSDLLVLADDGRLYGHAASEEGIDEFPVGPEDLDGASVRVGDLNRDGLKDLAVRTSQNLLRIFTGDGMGAFTETAEPVAFAMEGLLGKVFFEWADMNGDGLDDLLVVFPSVATGPPRLRLAVRLIQSNGSFGPQATYDAGDGWATGLRLFDANGDGRRDVLLFADDPGNRTEVRMIPNPAGSAAAQKYDFLEPVSTPLFSGENTFSLHLPALDVLDLGLLFAVEFAESPASSLDLTLVAPDGTELAIGGFSDFRSWPGGDSGAAAQGETGWRLSLALPAISTPGNLDRLENVHAAGTWRLVVDNQTGKTAEILAASLSMRAAFAGPRDGERADRATILSDLDYTAGVWAAGDTSGRTDKVSLSCAVTGGSPDQMFELTVPKTVQVDLRVSAAFKAALEVWNGPCDDADSEPLACDDGFMGFSPRLEELRLIPGSYCVIVDGLKEGGRIHGGPFELSVRHPFLGDGVCVDRVQGQAVFRECRIPCTPLPHECDDGFTCMPHIQADEFGVSLFETGYCRKQSHVAETFLSWWDALPVCDPLDPSACATEGDICVEGEISARCVAGCTLGAADCPADPADETRDDTEPQWACVAYPGGVAGDDGGYCEPWNHNPPVCEDPGVTCDPMEQILAGNGWGDDGACNGGERCCGAEGHHVCLDDACQESSPGTPLCDVGQTCWEDRIPFVDGEGTCICLTDCTAP